MIVAKTSEFDRSPAAWSRRALCGRLARLGLAAAGAAGAMGTAWAAPVVAVSPDDPERLTVIYNHNQFDFDPHASYGDASLVLLGIYEMLIQLDGRSPTAFAPMLAEGWEVSADRSRYTFYLPPRAVFHDGTPCDAAAVKASFARFLGLAATPVYIVSRFVQDAEQITVVDARTVQFDLGRPQPLFLSALASPFGPYIVNPRVVAARSAADDPWAREWLALNAAGAGTGPYTLAEHLPNERTTLRRFDGYHRGWAGDHFDEVVIRVVAEDVTRRELLERGDADIVTRLLKPEDVAALERVPTLDVEMYDAFDVGWVVMNAPKLRTPDVRRGFSYAFPYHDVIVGVEGGMRARTGPLPSGMRGYDPEVFLYPTDLARARDLILAAGFQAGDAFDYMSLAGHDASRATAHLFQANVQAMGFTLDLIEVDQGALFDVGFGALPAAERPAFLGSWGWYPDYNDPWIQLAPSFLRSWTAGGEGTANAGLWFNARFEEIMAEAKQFSDETRLTALMREAQRILTAEDPPCIYLGQQVYTTVLGADIRGFSGNPLYLNFYRYYELYRDAEN